MARRQVEQPESESEREDPIHVKYRPQRLEDVIGQREVVSSLTAALKGKTVPHAFLFAGPPGTGKTTLARLVGAAVGVAPQSIQEEDAASKSGVDDVRALTAPLIYSGFGERPNKMLLIDECHRLSKQAWDAFLKITEEPPPHVYFAFCTSEGDKVPASMVRRCLAYNLRPVRYDDIVDLLESVADKEGYNTPNKVLDTAAAAANGSPGLALQNLAKVHACRDQDEAAILLEQPGEMAEVIDLCRLLLKDQLTWAVLQETLTKVDVPAESIRIVIVNYLSSCLMRSKSDRETRHMLNVLAAFLKPCPTSDKLGPLLDAFGRYVYP